MRGYILERLKKERVVQERYIISERFFAGKKMGEIAIEMGMTYYQTRWLYRQALEKMRDSVRGIRIINRMEGKENIAFHSINFKAVNVA
ncbi:hypothetical protein BTJ45_03887 [Bacillus mycoides]|nr:hypothetical protein BTJ45_03887 [Bacillus mycoides]